MNSLDRRNLREYLPSEYFINTQWYLLWIIPNYLVIFFGIYILAAHFSFWYVPLIVIVSGTCINSLGYLAHNISHGSITKHPLYKKLFSAAAWLAFSHGSSIWEHWHPTHHAYTNTEKDPDCLFTLQYYKDSNFLQIFYLLPHSCRKVLLFLYCFLSPHISSFKYSYRFVLSRKNKSVVKLKFILWTLIPPLLWLCLLLFDWKVYVFAYFLPLMFASLISSLYTITNHYLCPMVSDSDIFSHTLSVSVPKWIDKIHFNNGAHLTHHLFPDISPKYIRLAEYKISELYPDRFTSMPILKALRLFFASEIIYEEGGVRFIDPIRNTFKPTLGNGL